MKFKGNNIQFIKIFNNFENYCMYDAEMEFKEEQERLDTKARKRCVIDD